MGLIPAILAGAGAIVSAAVAKVIADDTKEWAPSITRRLLDIDVRRLPEAQRERYAEEWAAHLAEIPGVVGKLAISLQFQIAAFWARELDAKVRLVAWRNERAAVMAAVGVIVGEVARRRGGDALLLTPKQVTGAFNDATRLLRELAAKRPALGITVAGASFMADRIFYRLIFNRISFRVIKAFRSAQLAGKSLLIRGA